MDWIAALSQQPHGRDEQRIFCESVKFEPTKPTKPQLPEASAQVCQQHIRVVLPVNSPHVKAQAPISNQEDHKSWISNHEAELKDVGYTDWDISGNGTWFDGLAGLSLWRKNDLRVELIGDILVFRISNGHQTIKQTCRPSGR